MNGSPSWWNKILSVELYLSSTDKRFESRIRFHERNSLIFLFCEACAVSAKRILGTLLFYRNPDVMTGLTVKKDINGLVSCLNNIFSPVLRFGRSVRRLLAQKNSFQFIALSCSNMQTQPVL